MKVPSGHTVSKAPAEDSMDAFIGSSPADKSGLSLILPPNANPSANPSSNENINRTRWMNLFRRMQKRSMDSNNTVAHPKRPLFGQPLPVICDEMGNLPKPIIEILTLLLRKGPYTEGVFRKAGNARMLREIKDQLNNGIEVDLKDRPVILLADLLKDFLRQLPGRLLLTEQSQAWMAAMEKQDENEKYAELKRVVDKLPQPNIILLKHLMVVLHHISKHANTNKMDSSNLALCVSPNLLLQTDKVEMMTKVSGLTQFLIDNCCEIFGEDLLTLLGDSYDEELDNQDELHHNDSAYESNDPDAEGDKGSCNDVKSVTSNVLDEGRSNYKPSSSPSPAARQTFKPFTRRSSEPAITNAQSERTQPCLTRSHTESDFQEKSLRKQISDEFITIGGESTVLKRDPFSFACQDCSRCSSSSLESGVCSASESPVFASSPHVSPCSRRKALQRKQSFPSQPTQPTQTQVEVTKKRSQSMKSSRNRACISRGGSNRAAVIKALRHSQTLPEVSLSEKASFDQSHKPRRLSSLEIFQQVDRKNPGEPPSYKQAVQNISHPALSRENSLTVKCAMNLSQRSCPSQTAEASNSHLMNDCTNRTSYQAGETFASEAAESTLMFREKSTSELVYEATHERLCCRCSQPLFENMSYVRESYV
ncbi:T cell activation RhoGTPase activating protein a [Chanos chanos]|uniref:T cell activation RhoGTPase activating protein a n=1 Tax=Chanos chanos TaxID=29144 RepID=A0A6J2WG62_CHACN|nr:T-cell activation Rho GTPase-activating protein-like [Chanos chanos]